jgi:dTDP-4-dehydrorhamnose reductase
MIGLSSNYPVYTKEYSEPKKGDTPNPVSVYGRTKLESERLIQSLTNRYFIVRTQWLYGKNGNNFVKTMINAAKSQQSHQRNRPKQRSIYDQGGSAAIWRQDHIRQLSGDF